MSPDLFNLYNERILRELETMPELVVGGSNINNLRYADDTVLIAKSEEQRQVVVDKVALESAKKVCVFIKKDRVPHSNQKKGYSNLEHLDS